MEETAREPAVEEDLPQVVAGQGWLLFVLVRVQVSVAYKFGYGPNGFLYTQTFFIDQSLMVFSAVISCPTLPPIANGMISYSPNMNSRYDFGTTATYECNVGFFLEGTPTRACTGDGSGIIGSWEGNAPRCSGSQARDSVRFLQVLLIPMQSINNLPAYN